MAGEKILVVDDAQIVCAALESELVPEGYDVDSAQDGEEALEMARSKRYDLVFVDFVMPAMDGVQTCKAIKDLSADSAIVIMTGKIDKYTNWSETAISGEDDIVHVINKASIEEDIGKVHYIYKPFDEGEILEVARKALAER